MTSSYQEFYTSYANAIYAGVLGKIIGVYIGRPVEGWAYERIEQEFGEIYHYVHESLNLPLIVADDDISGTFGFFRSIMDNVDRGIISSRDVGNTWLNYIIEDETILWWGGYGRSTEHTAYQNLKQGIESPQSGCFANNGLVLPEQIGAQIFIDAFAMMYPNDPEKAVEIIRKAATVSHDGIAVEAACFLGSLESMAFSEKSIDTLLDTGLRFVSDRHLLQVIGDVRDYCSKYPDWREARAKIDAKYGYGKYDGPCHIVPNHAVVLASLILGGESFRRSLMIASSSAWDTDCNAGNVGCLNGIRLGLDAINRETDYRSPVRDRMLVVTADSGACISDAVIETRKIVASAAALAEGSSIAVSPEISRFTFEFPGSLQGFQVCPYAKGSQAEVKVSNALKSLQKKGLLVTLDNCGHGLPGYFSTPTFIDFNELSDNFTTIASPTLYETQKVTITIETDEKAGLVITPYILVYDIGNEIRRIEIESWDIQPGTNQYVCKVPPTGGMPVFRFGCKSQFPENRQHSFIITSIDWKGAPAEYAQKGVLMKSIWDVKPFWLQVWASSAKQFAPDFAHTYCISHTSANGLVTQGTEDWDDYSIESSLYFSLHDRGGVVLRSCGHRRYYAALFYGMNTVSIIARRDDIEEVLSEKTFPYEFEKEYRVVFSAIGDTLSLMINGVQIMNVQHELYRYGAAGYLIDTGTMLAHDFIIRGSEV